jgi:hypothetical protein
MTKTKLDINVKWEIDENPDLDFLGIYTSKIPNTSYVDRKRSVLVIPQKDLEIELPFDIDFRHQDYEYIKSFNYENPSEEEYQYIFQDVQLLEGYNNQKWYMRGCIVTASLNGIELAKESVWGLDSTMTESENQEVINDLTSQAEESAKEKLGLLQSVELE